MKRFLLIAGQFFVLSLLCNSFVFCQEYQHSISYVPQVSIQPLSEKGRKYFEKQAYSTAYSVSNMYESEQAQESGYSVRSGQLSAAGNVGDCSAKASTDLLSIINFIPAFAEFLYRLIDINGYYYKQDAEDMYKQILYVVDKARYEIYKNHQSYRADAQYLQTKIYELEIQCRAVCTGDNKKCVSCKASREARETLQRSLQYVESQCHYTPEEKCKLQCDALTHAIATIRNTPFKKKERKQQLLTEYQEALTGEEQQYHAYQGAREAQQTHERALQRQRHIQQTFSEQLNSLEHEMRDSAVYAEQITLFASVFEKRTEAFNQSTQAYYREAYVINDDVRMLLVGNQVSLDTFNSCYGNQYQQCLHQESLTVLEHASQIPIDSLLYQHQQTIVTFAGVATDYNHVGECYKSVPLLDFCWTLLSWGTQIIEGGAEGAVAGLLGAATDIITHPIATGVSVLLGSSVMLTYQLSKIVYTVADLGTTTLIDSAVGKKKWDSYVEPINQLLDAIDKKQIGLKDVSKAVTQFGVQWYTQAKLLGGLRTFYDGIKNKVVLFLRTNPFVVPEQYFATPDGHLCKAAIHAVEQPVHECPASCINQYERLKGALTIEQFTSIIKTTKHGIQRLIERGFSPEEVNIIYKNPDITRIQKDGAKAFIKVISQNRYNLMIYNQKTESVITALKNIDLRNLTNLGKKYGWTF